MAEQEWTEVAKVGDLKEGVPVSIKAHGEKVLLVRVGGAIHACEGKCRHYGAPLEEGLLLGHVITCPWHNARFDVRTGRMVSPPALTSLARYPVKVEDGVVYLGPAEKPKAPRIEGKDDRTFAIVGGGAAGNAAAETLREEGFAGKVLLITAEAELPYDRPTLSKDFLSGEASREWLPLHNTKYYERRQIELLLEQRVAAIDPDKKVLSLADGAEIRFDAALLATGGAPRKPDIPGTHLDGFFLLRSAADAEAIVAALDRTKRAVILGAGFIGMEAASSLRERELEVHVVAPEQVPMARVFGDEVGRWLRRQHEQKGVIFHLGRTATEIRGDGRVKEVALSDGSTVGADIVIAGIGVTPAVDCLRGTGLAADGAVPVDGRLATEAEGIYAAGDIALVPDPWTGERHRVEHWIVAERQGQHAARAMLGSDAPYSEVPFFWTKQGGASLKYVGYGGEYDRVAVRGSIEDGDFLAGYYAGGRLLAASGAGRAREIAVAAEILRAGENVPPERLADEETDLRGYLT